MLSLIFPLLDASARPALLVLSILYVMDQVRDLLEAAPLVARLIFVVEMIVAVGIIVWLLRRNSGGVIRIQNR